MKQTAIQQAIEMVRSRIDSIDETLMGKHTIHHLQQIERGLYDLLEAEKQQIIDAYADGINHDYTDLDIEFGIGNSDREYHAKQYYNKMYNDNK